MAAMCCGRGCIPSAVTLWPKKSTVCWAKWHLAALMRMNVVQVDEDELELVEEVVHEVLKRLGCIAESKRHDHILKQAKRCDDGRLWDVFSCHWDLVVAFD